MYPRQAKQTHAPKCPHGRARLAHAHTRTRSIKHTLRAHERARARARTRTGLAMARVVQLAIDVLAVTIHPRRRVCVCGGTKGGMGAGD